MDYLNPFSENFLGNQIIDGIINGIKAIFIPDENAINSLISSVTDKFRFVDTIKNAMESYKTMFSDIEALPKMYITLPENKYLSGDILLIDLAWYAPFKPYGDLIISAFIYVCFVWRIFIKLPNIIGGAGGNVESFVLVDKISGGGKK